MNVNLAQLGHLGFRSFGFAFITEELRTGTVWQAQLCGEQNLTSDDIADRVREIRESHNEPPLKLEIYSRLGPFEYYERITPFSGTDQECIDAIVKEWSSLINFVSGREADKLALQFFISYTDEDGKKVEDRPRDITEAFAFASEYSILNFVQGAQLNLGTNEVTIDYQIRGPRDLFLEGAIIANGDQTGTYMHIIGRWIKYQRFWSYGLPQD